MIVSLKEEKKDHVLNGVLFEPGLWCAHNCFYDQHISDFLHAYVKVCFTQKMLVKLSHHHSSEPFFAPELLFPVDGMNSSDKMSIFSFFCINQINLLKLIQTCTHVIINNFIAFKAL